MTRRTIKVARERPACKTQKPNSHNKRPCIHEQPEPSAMASFMVDLWESIFTPGPTASLLKATNISFAALQLVLLALLYATFSIHFVVMSVLCAGLWWSINWFATELAIAQANDKKEKDKDNDVAGGDAAASGDGDKAARPVGAATAVVAEGDSDTEVETRTAGKKSKSKSKAKRRTADVEPLEEVGEMKHRAETPVGTLSQSSVSTEDEWEKVSGSEKDKDK